MFSSLLVYQFHCRRLPVESVNIIALFHSESQEIYLVILLPNIQDKLGPPTDNIIIMSEAVCLSRTASCLDSPR